LASFLLFSLDQHYTVCPRVLTKAIDIENAEDYWYPLVQQYRARAEHTIGRLVRGHKLFCERPRINYSSLWDFLNITAHTQNLLQRTSLMYPVPDQPSMHFFGGSNVYFPETEAPTWIWNERDARRQMLGL